MKDKNLAGILGLFFGGLGVHRFYLGQIGLGILYLFFFYISWFIGIIDALVFLSMDQEEFDRKFNKDFYSDRDYERYERHRARYERERRRAERDSDTNRRRRRSTSPPIEPKPTRRSEPAKPHNPYRQSGISKFRDFDYEGAIADFEKSLEVDPQDIASHFNLACAYSLIEKKDKSFYHLDRAVANGFDDFQRIKTHDALAFLRIQSEFDQFEQNGFRLTPQLEAPKQDLLSQDATPIGRTLSNELLEQLQRLGDLREKGLLTEEEFTAQKRRLLG